MPNSAYFVNNSKDYKRKSSIFFNKIKNILYLQRIIILIIAIIMDTKNIVEKESKKIDSKKLDYWLMQNVKAMEELTVLQPACWAEADHPND